jgi:hypothetical protein
VVARRRFVPEPVLAPDPAPALMPTPERVRLLLNRNLMNYPLARDRRSTMYWRKSPSTGRWVAQLPQENRILVILPADTPESERRAPTGLDMAVLFTLLARAQAMRTPQVTLSWAKLLRWSSLALDKDSRAAVRSALRYLSRLTLQIECWFVPRSLRGERGRQVRRVLSPPIADVSYEGRSVSVVVAEDWWALRETYYQEVTLPLPLKAVDQNATLMVLTSEIKWRDDDPTNPHQAYYLRGQSGFARKIGLSPVRRRSRLIASLNRVKEWFVTMGGDFDALIGPVADIVPRGQLGFIGATSRPPRSGGERIASGGERIASGGRTYPLRGGERIVSTSR